MACFKRYTASATMLSLAILPVPSMAAAPSDLNDLVGARGSSGETQLQSRGYYNHHTSPADAGLYSYWWNQSNKQCVRVLTSDGRYSAIKTVGSSDCGQNGSSGDKTAAVAVGAAALIGVLALASKSHHKNDRDYDTQGTADFERGYRDGLYNQSYHNYSRADAYSDGYSAGVNERGHQTDYRPGYAYQGGYQAYSGYSDIVGRSVTSADSTLRQRGYVYQGKDQLSSGHERTYWNPTTRQCISVRTRGGDVDDAHSLRNRDCR